jgi:hypothetical protein
LTYFISFGYGNERGLDGFDVSMLLVSIKYLRLFLNLSIHRHSASNCLEMKKTDGGWGKASTKQGRVVG